MAKVKITSYNPKTGPSAAEKAANARIMFGSKGVGGKGGAGRNQPRDRKGRWK